MSRRGPQNCPWTSSKKRQKQRKTETITMSEETKSGLADSDNRSYYQHYFSTSSDSDGENIGCFLEVFLFSLCPLLSSIPAEKIAVKSVVNKLDLFAQRVKGFV